LEKTPDCIRKTWKNLKKSRKNWKNPGFFKKCAKK
jgi:hypothetical protein